MISTEPRYLRDPFDIPSSAPVVIIGGGIVGVASALFLSWRGIPSILLETESAPGLRTTAMSAHCIRAQFGEPDNIRMMAESLDFYENIGSRCEHHGQQPSIGLRQQGYLFASTNPADREPFRQRIEQQQAAGLDDVELLDGDEVRHRYPWLSTDITIATYRKRDGWIDSAAAIQAMAAVANAPIYSGVTVSRIQVHHEQVTGVVTSHGTIATGCVVLAAGPFSRHLSPEHLPIVLWRRHRLIVGPWPAIPQTGPVTIDANTGAHWRPHLGGALAAWAQPEVDTEAIWPVPADPRFIDRILHGGDGIGRLAPFWGEVAPTLTTADLHLTAGQYTITPDHRPLIGPAEQTGGLFLHTGYSGHGIMGAPAGARILADSIAASGGANPFHPARFAGHITPPDVERVII